MVVGRCYGNPYISGRKFGIAPRDEGEHPSSTRRMVTIPPRDPLGGVPRRDEEGYVPVVGERQLLDVEELDPEAPPASGESTARRLNTSPGKAARGPPRAPESHRGSMR